MDLFCKVCDRSIIETESEYNNYLSTLVEKNHDSFYNKYTINNVTFDGVIEILNDCVSTHNKNLFY